MVFDQDAFVAEVNTAIDNQQVEVKEEVTNGGETEGLGAVDAGGATEDGSSQGGEDGACEERSSVEEAGPEVEKVAGEAGPVVTQDAPKISDELLIRAVSAGLDPKTVRDFNDPDVLSRVVATIEKRSTTEKVEQVADDDPLAKLPKLDDFEPEVIQTIESLVAEVRRQRETVAKLQEKQEYVARSAAEANTREVEQWFDRQVDSLGEDFTDALGKGKFSTLPKGSSQLAKRESIANQVADLLAGYHATGKTPPPREEVFDLAARIVLRDEFQAVAEKKLSAKLGKRAGQHIQRASGGKVTSKSKPEDEVAAILNEKYFK
jgi:hypothetical protein